MRGPWRPQTNIFYFAFIVLVAGSGSILVEAEAPRNIPLPPPLSLPLCFKAAVRILVDFYQLDVISFRFFYVYLNHVQIILVFLRIMMLDIVS
jgi:hypothetical protein